MQADWLFLLTDVDCVYTANPNTNPDAEPIHEVHDITQLHVSWEGVYVCVWVQVGAGAAARLA